LVQSPDRSRGSPETERRARVSHKTIKRFARQGIGQIPARNHPRVEINSGPQSHGFQHEHKVLGDDVARGARREGAAPTPFHRLNVPSYCGIGRAGATMAAPLQGLRVVEINHRVMGPAVGKILADLGADAVKVEPVGDDPTWRFQGSGAGGYPVDNRGKRFISVDCRCPDGLDDGTLRVPLAEDDPLSGTGRQDGRPA
jgi:hypothetical protein